MNTTDPGCASVADYPVLPACRDGEPHPCSLEHDHNGPHLCATCGQTWERGPWDDDVERLATVTDIKLLADEYAVDIAQLAARAFAEPSDVLKRMTPGALRDLAREIRSSQS
jgi:hypothetical protein